MTLSDTLQVRAQIERSGSDLVPAEVVAEKDAMIAGLRETNELNETKVRAAATAACATLPPAPICRLHHCVGCIISWFALFADARLV